MDHLQVCGIHTVTVTGILPCKQMIGVVTQEKPVVIKDKQKEDGDEHAKYGIMLNEYGEVCYYARNVIMRRIILYITGNRVFN